MFCIMRTEKRKRTDLGGIQRENTRTATEYNNKVSPGMDIFNVTLKESSNWLQDINNEIKAAGAKTRSNSVLALDTIYTASPDFFKGKQINRMMIFQGLSAVSSRALRAYYFCSHTL